jgi:large subunit ribosomal protein L3
VAIELLCRKVGMTRIFTDNGTCIPVTVLEAGPNAVLQKKTEEKDGYTAVQLGFQERRRSTLSKGALGHFDKAGVGPKRHVHECRVTAEELDAHEVGGEIKADIFEAGQMIDAVGTSRGRGTMGVVRRHNFKVKRKTHGTHEGFRNPGAIGAGSYPGKVFKGQGMFGRMGGEKHTSRNLEIVKVDLEQNLLLVKGGIAGHPGGLVTIRPAVAGK